MRLCLSDAIKKRLLSKNLCKSNDKKKKRKKKIWKSLGHETVNKRPLWNSFIDLKIRIIVWKMNSSYSSSNLFSCDSFRLKMAFLLMFAMYVSFSMRTNLGMTITCMVGEDLAEEDKAFNFWTLTNRLVFFGLSKSYSFQKQIINS